MLLYFFYDLVLEGLYRQATSKTQMLCKEYLTQIKSNGRKFMKIINYTYAKTSHYRN